ncbi:hypothetical protein JMJ77_0011563, partial [Colletotrichum scovillei]
VEEGGGRRRGEQQRHEAGRRKEVSQHAGQILNDERMSVLAKQLHGENEARNECDDGDECEHGTEKKRTTTTRSWTRGAKTAHFRVRPLKVPGARTESPLNVSTIVARRPWFPGHALTALVRSHAVKLGPGLRGLRNGTRLPVWDGERDSSVLRWLTLMPTEYRLHSVQTLRRSSRSAVRTLSRRQAQP